MRLPRVELLNVPIYRQGSFDNLCAYYTGAMMLSALFPEYTRSFGETARERATKKLSDDPLIKNFGGKDHRKILAKWYYQGEYISNVTQVLNRIMSSDSRGTKFTFQSRNAVDGTFHNVIAGSIDLGLPVMFGWSTPDYGDHAVLITGYWEGQEKWLLINDPAGDTHQISWDSLREQKKERFEVGLCDPDSHTGYRPLKRTEATPGYTPVIERWTGDGYKRIEDDFTDAREPGTR